MYSPINQTQYICNQHVHPSLNDYATAALWFKKILKSFIYLQPLLVLKFYFRHDLLMSGSSHIVPGTNGEAL